MRAPSRAIRCSCLASPSVAAAAVASLVASSLAHHQRLRFGKLPLLSRAQICAGSETNNSCVFTEIPLKTWRMKNSTLVLLLSISISSLKAQYYQQYFDGADTTVYNSVIIQLDTAAGNLWQVGPPQKTLFNSPMSAPNVLVTDTVQNYPAGNHSRFSFDVVSDFPWGIVAVQWMQKLDMAPDLAGGMVEFSEDQGITWQNVFDNPYVYNLYGFQNENVDTLYTGDLGFVGTDTVWRNIWLCYMYDWMQPFDTLQVRFTFLSDSLDSTLNHEGWMIDNFLVQPTIVHTVGERTQDEYVRAYPNPAVDRVFIETQKLQQYHIIERMELFDAKGRSVQQWSMIPTKFFIDVRQHPPGIYSLRIQTNIRTETVSIAIER